MASAFMNNYRQKTTIDIAFPSFIDGVMEVY